VLSVKAKDVAHVLVNVSRSKGQVFYSVHKSGADQVKVSEETLFDTLDDMIDQISENLDKPFMGITEYEAQLANQKAEDEGKSSEEDKEKLTAGLGKMIFKTLHGDEHPNLISALEAEYKGMINMAFMNGVASENFLKELSKWRDFHSFTSEQHDKVLADLGKTEEEWDHLKQWGRPSPQDDAQTCIICMVQNKDALFPACGHICTCFSCANELEDCPLCRKAFGKQVPIRVYM